MCLQLRLLDAEGCHGQLSGCDDPGRKLRRWRPIWPGSARSFGPSNPPQRWVAAGAAPPPPTLFLLFFTFPFFPSHEAMALPSASCGAYTWLVSSYDGMFCDDPGALFELAPEKTTVSRRQSALRCGYLQAATHLEELQARDDAVDLKACAICKASIKC